MKGELITKAISDAIQSIVRRADEYDTLYFFICREAWKRGINAGKIHGVWSFQDIKTREELGQFSDTADALEFLFADIEHRAVQSYEENKITAKR